MKSGVVKCFNSEKGYGFIIPQASHSFTPDVFVHKDCIEGGMLHRGDCVCYTPVWDQRSSKLRAEGVIIQRMATQSVDQAAQERSAVSSSEGTGAAPDRSVPDRKRWDREGWGVFDLKWSELSDEEQQAAGDSAGVALTGLTVGGLDTGTKYQTGTKSKLRTKGCGQSWASMDHQDGPAGPTGSPWPVAARSTSGSPTRAIWPSNMRDRHSNKLRNVRWENSWGLPDSIAFKCAFRLQGRRRR